MSLINDALKRASQGQSTTNSPPTIEQPMEPVPPHRAVSIPGYFTPVLLFVICGAFWFIYKGWDGTQQANLNGLIGKEPIIAQAREAVFDQPEDLPPTHGVELGIPRNRQFALNDGPTPVTGMHSTSTEVAAARRAITSEETLVVSAREIPASNRFRLQGIFYRPSSPSAVINSKTVFVGDTIADATVRKIDQKSVTLDLGPETQVLTLR